MKMHVGIHETGHDEFPLGVNHAASGEFPVQLLRLPDGCDPVPSNGDRPVPNNTALFLHRDDGSPAYKIIGFQRHLHFLPKYQVSIGWVRCVEELYFIVYGVPWNLDPGGC